MSLDQISMYDGESDVESLHIEEDFQGYESITQDPSEIVKKFPEATRSSWALFLNRSDVVGNTSGQFDDDKANSSEDIANLPVDPEVSRPSTSYLIHANVEHERSFGRHGDSKPKGDPPDEAVSIASDDTHDSERSYSAEQRRGKRKRTKKEQRKAVVAKKRRISHPPKLVSCNCRKNCSDSISMDDRKIIHAAFWKLNNAAQSDFFRERVARVPIERRRTNRHVLKEPHKLHSYHFSLEMADKRVVRVCRKFFLNTIGYSEHCE